MTEPATEKQIKFMQSLKLPYNSTITKEEAKICIQEALEKPDIVKPGIVATPRNEFVKPKSKFNDTAMYTSYAKDIFCALLLNTMAAKEDVNAAMDLAIEVVKQAREAF